jgi:hypothetical protein
MAVITHGGDLVAALAESGTGAAKLAVARAELERVFEAKGREATAAEVVAAMAAADVGEGTLAKARALCETGQVRLPELPAEPIEVRLRKLREAAPKPDDVTPPAEIPGKKK